ncbi:50S ribosomal protein L10 [Chloroflexota bacterium]
MSREKKAQVIDSLQEVFSKCSMGVLTDYRGLTTAELSDLRRKLRASGIEYKVVKNTLAQFAAERAKLNELAGSFQGPVAIAFGYGEVTEPAKALADYIRSSKSDLAIKGGFLDDRLLTSGDVEIMAKMPPREVLISQVMAGIQSPIIGLVNVLAAPLRGMMGVLQARIQQLEGN